jgi:CRISPR-associated protein Cas2
MFSGSWAAKILQDKLIRIIDTDKDSIRYYYLGDEWKRRVEHVGRKTSFDMEGPLII